MKALIQIAILGVGIYLAYGYWKENYSTKGVAERESKEKAVAEAQASNVAKVKADWLFRAKQEAQKIIDATPSFAGGKTMVTQMLNAVIDEIYKTTDWLAVSLGNIEMPSANITKG